MRGRLGAAATVLLLVSMALGDARADQAIDGVAAIVGEDVILHSEVAIAAAQLLARVRAQQGSVPRELANQAHDEALRTLIDAKLLVLDEPVIRRRRDEPNLDCRTVDLRVAGEVAASGAAHRLSHGCRTGRLWSPAASEPAVATTGSAVARDRA